MTTFQQLALLLTLIWLVLTLVFLRRSLIVVIAGLVALSLYTLLALATGAITLEQIGLGLPTSWLLTVGLAAVWLVVMLIASPLADWLASRVVARPPTLGAFRAIQQSTARLIAGIMAAIVLGGVLEELIARGIVLQSMAALLGTWLSRPVAVAVAVCVAALGAGIMHAYQGPRAVLIITQLSLLFGVLFVVSGFDLWSVMLCHAAYDAIAFVRFANRQSKYSRLESGETTSPGK